ncbi:glucosyltransferase domain-containing protein [Aminobacter aminovorans]|uniref:glucosyltransferase domain-containing protein n=1 Tax=Aminobacter aminovorans TaxID=83263 RepID=UPI002854EF8B|nr:glucosyltransferase domain-containing protein [Aminobacter aminovorans]MDR7222769.1 hypothetical protein [Aminobacter aminovorans]
MMMQSQASVRQASILFAIFCAIYFFELASFPLSIDEELAAFRTDASVWVAQGRWGAYLIETIIMPQPILPFITPGIFGAGCVVAYLLVMDMIGQSELSLTEYACFAIFCGFPTWFFIVEFYSNIAAVGIAFAFMTFAVWLANRQNGSKPILQFCCAIAAGAFAFSIYQSLAPAMLTMGIAIAVLRALRGSEESFSKNLVRIGFLLAGSLMLYAVGLIAFKAFITLRSEYFDSLFQPAVLFQQPFAVASRALTAMADAIGLRQHGYGAALWAIPPLLALGGAAIFFGPSRQRIGLTAAAAVSLVVPFGLHLVSAGNMPMRSLVGVPIAIWLFTYAAVDSRHSKLRVPARVMLLAALFQILVIQNSYQASSYLAGKHDALLATSVQQRLSLAPGFDPKITYALSTFGSRPFTTVYPRPDNSTVGHSFFEWDGGNPWRIASYMRLLGFTNLTGATPEQVDQTIVRLATLPVWPAPGSVQIDGSIALVRLGETPSYANQQALKRAGNR